jgi:heme/copper-type cytochrome/quinol oxidase subunit 3
VKELEMAGGPRRIYPSVEARAATARLAMWLALIALSMVFLGLLGSLIVARGKGNWPPAGVRLNLPLGAINTCVILASSGALAAALSRARQEKSESARLALQLSGSLAVCFLCLQAVQYYQLVRSFHEPIGKTQFGTYFYALTGLHAAHLIAGVGWLGALWATGAQRNPRALDLCALYWHFVTGVWLVLFVVLYLL